MEITINEIKVIAETVEFTQQRKITDYSNYEVYYVAKVDKIPMSGIFYYNKKLTSKELEEKIFEIIPIIEE